MLDCSICGAGCAVGPGVAQVHFGFFSSGTTNSMERFFGSGGTIISRIALNTCFDWSRAFCAGMWCFNANAWACAATFAA